VTFFHWLLRIGKGVNSYSYIDSIKHIKYIVEQQYIPCKIQINISSNNNLKTSSKPCSLEGELLELQFCLVPQLPP
jgi:hypothetical protein